MLRMTKKKVAKRIWGRLKKKVAKKPKNFGDAQKKGGQKNLGIYVQKVTTLDISRRYID